MQRVELLPLILDHQNFFQKPSDIIPRSIPVSPCLDGSEVNLIYGPLHVGKTSFLKQVSELLQGMKIYINFEDSRFKGLEHDSLLEIGKIVNEYCRKESEVEEGVENEEKSSKEKLTEPASYFLDEIQYVHGWESWVDRLQSEGARVFITSSSSSLINQNISSCLESRVRILRLQPFSFKEYLTLKGLRVPRPNFLTPSRCDEMLCHFLRYFECGGFPDVIKKDNYKLSREYFEEILKKEIIDSIDRHNIQDPEGLKRLAVFLISNMASEYSLDKLKNASWIDSEDTIRNYIDYLEEAFLLYRVPRFNHITEKTGKENGKEIPCKVYAGDTGFFKTVFPNYPDSLGLRFENLVFLELLRRGKQISYFQDTKECDFLVTEKGSHAVESAIQVSVYFGSPAVREREILGLMGAMEEFGLDEGLILTMDDEGVMEIEGKDGEKKKIIINSVWKWMLE